MHTTTKYRLAMVLSTLFALTACSGPASPDEHGTKSSAQHDGSRNPSSPAANPEAAGGVSQQSLGQIITEVTNQYGGSLGVAVHAGGSQASAGDTAARPAWSSSKVPLAIAALNRDANLLPDAASAITVSDNAAATRLWQSLGTPEQASQAVASIVGQSGVQVTFPANPPRPEFSAFGQTAWSPAQQAQFAAHLPCIPGAGNVRSMMRNISSGQDYGLGQLTLADVPAAAQSAAPAPGRTAEFKGGWGPTPAGAYEVRQLGLIEAHGDHGGVIGLALTAEAADGSYATAQQMLNAAAAQLQPVLNSVHGFDCTQH